MVTASSTTVRRGGLGVEPDGSLTIEQQPAPSEAEVEEATRPLYHVANPTLNAAFTGPGRIHSYQVFGVGPILEAGAWRQVLCLDGCPPAALPRRTQVRGRLFKEVWEGSGCQLTVSSFCDARRNALFQAYQLAGHDDRPHTLEVTVRASFLVDEEQGAYGLHFDERHGAIVSLLGRSGQEAQAIPAHAVLFGADLAPAEWRVSDQRAYLTYGLQAPAHGERAFCLVLTGGWSRAEHEALFQQAARGWPQELVEARRHGDWLARRLELDDVQLHGMFVASLNCAASAYRQDSGGRFRGLLHKPEEGREAPLTMPADAYWCAQALLPYQPEMVRDEILALARAVHEDGQLARGVRAIARQGGDLGPYDVWPAACDSPSYLAMLVHDYLCWTGEEGILAERQDGRSVWDRVCACVDYLRQRDTNRDYLFEKRRSDPDWAFDVLRDDWVTYDLALHCQALKNVAEIALLRGDADRASDYATWAAGAQKAINQRLWSEARDYYVDYIRSYQGFVEDHLAIDTVIAPLFGIGTESQCHRHLEHLEQTLETRHNDQQYYGDWGVMSCFPFYKERADLEGRSAWAYSFHNGAAWPGWCGVYALAELLHRRPGWRYGLERWWSYSLAQSWLTPPEYYAPPYDAPEVRQSAPLYAWSAMPAAAMILGGFGFWPNLAGEVVLHVPPWGDSRLNGVRLRGETYDVVARGGAITVLQDGDAIASSSRGLRMRLGRIPVAP